MSKLGADGLLTDDAIAEAVITPEQRQLQMKYYGEIQPFGGGTRDNLRAVCAAQRDAMLEAMDAMPIGCVHETIKDSTFCLYGCPACAVESFKVAFRKAVKRA